MSTPTDYFAVVKVTNPLGGVVEWLYLPPSGKWGLTQDFDECYLFIHRENAEKVLGYLSKVDQYLTIIKIAP